MALELRSIAIDADTAEVTLYDGRRLVSVRMTLLEVRDPARFVAVVARETGRRLDGDWPDVGTWRGWLWYRFNVPLRNGGIDDERGKREGL